MDPKFFVLIPLGAVIGYAAGKAWHHLAKRVNAAAVNLNDLDALDFPATCDVGPEGVYARDFEQCRTPAAWNAEVHHCDGSGEDTTIVVPLCDQHLAIIAIGVAQMIDQHRGDLPCGKHADSVFDLIQATRIF